MFLRSQFLISRAFQQARALLEELYAAAAMMVWTQGARSSKEGKMPCRTTLANPRISASPFRWLSCNVHHNHEDDNAFGVQISISFL